MSDMNKNQKGFSFVEILIAVVVVGLVGASGWYIWQSNGKKSEQQTSTQTSPPTSQEQSKEEEKIDYSTFSVKPTGKLTDQGKCKTGEVLFARIYNTSPGESYEYECQGPLDAIQYTSVVFGKRTSSVVGVFSEKSRTGESVTLANGVKAMKYNFEGQRKGHGTSEMQPTKYMIYEATDGEEYFYALYWTGVGFQDEDYFLEDFNSMSLKNWEIK